MFELEVEDVTLLCCNLLLKISWKLLAVTVMVVGPTPIRSVGVPYLLSHLDSRKH
jgi:hypothetical protein